MPASEGALRAHARRSKAAGRKGMRTPKTGTKVVYQNTPSLHGRKAKGMGIEFKPYYTAFPYRQNCILNMTKKITLSTQNSGTTTQDQFGDEWVFRLNSIFQPQLTTGAGANRVAGYTTIATLYASYKVVGVTVDVEVYDPDQDGLVVGIGYQPALSALQLVGQKVDDIDARQGYYVASFSNTGSQKKHFKKFISMHKLLGLTKAQFNADASLYSATITGNPSQVPYLRIALASTANATNSFARALVRLHFHTMLWGKIVEDQVDYTA